MTVTTTAPTNRPPIAEKGEVGIESGGKLYIFKFSFRFENRLQKHFKKGLQAVLLKITDPESADSTDVFAQLLALACVNYPEMTPEQAIEIVDDVGLPLMLAKFQEARTVSMPPAVAGDAGGKPAGDAPLASEAPTLQ